MPQGNSLLASGTNVSPSIERYDPDTIWSHLLTNQGDHVLSVSIVSSSMQFSVRHPPLFPTIPLERVVIDNVHLFLRISDVSTNHLILKLR